MRPVERRLGCCCGVALQPHPAEAAGERGRERPVRLRRSAAGRDPRGPLQQHGDDDGGDQDIDRRRIPLVGAGEAGRAAHEAVPDRHDERRGHEEGEGFLHRGEPGIAADHFQAEAGEEARAEGLHDDREQHQEAGKDHQVHDAGEANAQEPPVQADIGEDACEAVPGPVEAAGRASLREWADPSAGAPPGGGGGAERRDQEDQGLGGHAPTSSLVPRRRAGQTFRSLSGGRRVSEARRTYRRPRRSGPWRRWARARRC